MKLITDVSRGGEGENAVSAYCVSMDKKLYIVYLWRRWEWMQYQPTVCTYYTCGEGETAVSAHCVSMDKKLYSIPVAKVKMQYQPTLLPWTKNSITCGNGENECNTSLLCVHGQKKLYIIPMAKVRMNAIPAYCVYILYLRQWWEWMQYQPAVCSWTFF